VFRNLALVCVALVLCACASSGKAKGIDAGFWVTPPHPGSLTIVGMSGPLLKREREINAAREEAARKISMYHGVNVSFESVHSDGSSIFDYSSSSSLALEYDDDLEKYKDRLTYDGDRDVARSGGSVFIRFAYPAGFPFPVSYTSRKNADGSPVWVQRPPGEIDGFTAGVGFSAKKSRVKDSYAASCDSAAAAIVSRLSTSVITTTIASPGKNTVTILQRSSGRLKGFLVLDIWVDPKTKAVWTLAIAQKAE
jgi:hypothetical protein